MRYLAILTSASLLALPLVFGAATSSAAPPTPWKDMNPQQRGRYMKDVVTPKMKVTFQQFDPELFAKFDCSTCHGKDAKARKFKMPGPDVHALPGTPEAFMAALKAKPSWEKWTKFMGEKVEPQVGALLGLPLFDPKNAAAGGFGCQNCHTIEGKPAK